MGVIEQLFGSKTRVKLLQLFFSNPNRSFYVREITRKIDEQINSVRRELANLLNIGIISSDNTNNRLYYEVNQSYEYYQPLSAIFGNGTMGKVKSAPSAKGESQELKALGNIDLALLTGQITRDERSGIDVLLVGDLNQAQVAKYISELEAKESKELRYVVMDSDEFNYRQEVNDRFLTLVLGSKMQILTDKNYRLTPKPVEQKPKESDVPNEKTGGKSGDE